METQAMLNSLIGICVIPIVMLIAGLCIMGITKIINIIKDKKKGSDNK